MSLTSDSQWVGGGLEKSSKLMNGKVVLGIFFLRESLKDHMMEQVLVLTVRL